MSISKLSRSTLLCFVASILLLSVSAKPFEEVELANGGVTFNPSPEDPPHYFKVREGFIRVDLNRQLTEVAEFAVNSSSSGFARVTRVGVSVSRGATATMNYDISVTATSADILSRSDSRLVSMLSSEERQFYDRLVSSYRGGLNVPWLRWLGINLDRRTTRERMEFAASRQENYTERSIAASEVLDTFTDQVIQVTGTIEATGTSFIPQEAFVFIRVSVVTLQDGSSLNVVSADDNDVIVRTGGGRELPTDNSDLDIFPL